MNIHFKTFGCKVNQCESNDMVTQVCVAGCTITAKPNDADTIVINSCTVTSNADRKIKQYLRRCQRLNPTSKIYLTGCYVDRAQKELKGEFPSIKLFRNSEKQNLIDILDFSSSSTPINVGTNSIRAFAHGYKQWAQPLTATSPTTNSPNSLQSPVFSGHTRAFVNIQNGCDGKCSYCIVPKVRPKLWSKNIDDIILEIKNYVSAGYKEIVLCGIRLGKYGWGLAENLPLIDLIKRLEKIDGLYRVRLSSIELNDISDDLIELMSASKKLCHHLHIPLQSGDDEILKNMNRPYTINNFFDKIKKIRKNVSDIGITTDIIIGYPIDTEKTLQNTYNFVEKCAFSRLHIFEFSKRPNTEAALINKSCPSAIIKKWKEKFRLLDLKLRKDFLKESFTFSNKKLEVLTESNGYGYTSNYIYIKLPIAYPENEIVYCEK
ncbi:MAG: tRNA (N(6)-L-threonylcarbamoyladenosine(37)-C(2))-methylthiotransferase MtaB [Elusimicrobiota bacterium]